MFNVSERVILTTQYCSFNIRQVFTEKQFIISHLKRHKKYSPEKKRLPSWELILLLKKSEELSKKRSKKLERNKEYFKTTLLIEFDVPRYTSKRIRKREQNWRKSRINCDFLSRHKQRIAFQSSWQPPISANQSPQRNVQKEAFIQSC